MCGIAGAVGRLDRPLVDAVQAAADSMRPRGPDAEGLWVGEARGDSQDERPRVALAHRRLSIIDLSERGRQPMVDRATGNVLTYNGEVYNYRSLRSELEREGVSFDSDSDTEVILRGYAAWGEAVIERLDGMFAFGIWDASARKLLLARDRLGIKPLYFARTSSSEGDDCFLFASQVRALLATGRVDARLSPVALSTYLWHGFVAGDEPIIAGLRRLPAGTSAWVDERGAMSEPRPYWRLPDEPGSVDDLDELVATLEESVEQRLVADVPLGVFLSGGIDSSAMAALASRRSPDAIQTFNVCFDEAGFDESPWARRVAEGLGTRHHEIKLTESTFQAQLDDALGGLDQPTFDGINTYFVSRAVREAGITVALSGAGGDELFGGYTSFADLPRARRISGLASKLPLFALSAASRVAARLLGGRPGAVPPQTRWGKLADVFATRGDLRDAYQVSYSLYTRDFLAELGSSRLAGLTDFGLSPERARALDEAGARGDLLEAISRLELRSFIGDRLLEDTDCASMEVSLEVRVPLLDHRVVEAASRLAPSVRYAPLGEKQVLRRAALGELDPSLFDRPKSGFVLPIEPWSRAALASQITDAFSDAERCEGAGLSSAALLKLWRAYRDGAPGMYWSRIWAPYALLDWTRRHGATL